MQMYIFKIMYGGDIYTISEIKVKKRSIQIGFAFS